ncbi:hypothetical protein [Mesobacillus foraminis]|uniref:Uncharacterized protein n=1 Tax=Mesobacillus foraminis TaxID=279826 RepID=A0A4R2BBM5_9BACI|nr:hypothetical protein [Mesobacillus foraminis]TCN24126.1 hypothetical protein EV146_108240 [Mesobacillus foraminis]
MNKLLKLLGGSLLSAMLLVGCGTNDDNDPPPNGDTDVQNPADDNDGAEINRFDNNNGNNGGNNGNGNNDDTNGERIFNDNNNNNDTNRDGDGDMFRDNNDRGEDGMEDDLDRNDRDEKDR